MKRLLWLALAVGLASPPQLARSEVFLLANGGRVEGELLNKDESPRKSYVVQTLLGGQLTLSKSQVERVVVRSVAEKVYEEAVRKMPDTLEGHLKMAEWCRQNDLLSKRQLHLQEVIAREPDHAAARHALGYSKIDDRWLKSDEYMKSQGFVRHQGVWRLQQEVEAELAAKKFEQEVVDWKRKLRILRTRYGKKGDGGALAEIKGVLDPVASVAFADLLGSEDFREVKLLYIEMLGRLPSPAGVAALTKHALADDDETIRDACLRVLTTQGTQQAVGAFTKILSGKDNRMINRAGAGLGRIADEDSIPALIDAIVTQHKMVVGGGGGGLGSLSPTFNGSGGGGLTAGSKTKIIIQDLPNESVLGALRAITKQDFGYDKKAWKAWYSATNTPKDVNLRRRDE